LALELALSGLELKLSGLEVALSGLEVGLLALEVVEDRKLDVGGRKLEVSGRNWQVSSQIWAHPPVSRRRPSQTALPRSKIHPRTSCSETRRRERGLYGSLVPLSAAAVVIVDLGARIRHASEKQLPRARGCHEVPRRADPRRIFREADSKFATPPPFLLDALRPTQDR